MDKQTARDILTSATSMDSSFQRMFVLIESIHDENLKNDLSQSLGIALQNITVGVIFKLEQLFPDLKVDE